MFNRNLKGNFSRMYNMIFSGMGNITKTSTGSFKGTLMGSLTGILVGSLTGNLLKKKSWLVNLSVASQDHTLGVHLSKVGWWRQHCQYQWANNGQSSWLLDGMLNMKLRVPSSDVQRDDQWEGNFTTASMGCFHWTLTRSFTKNSKGSYNEALMGSLTETLMGSLNSYFDRRFNGNLDQKFNRKFCKDFVFIYLFFCITLTEVYS